MDLHDSFHPFLKLIGIQFVYIKIRNTARPTAEIETSVPMQYFMTSYLAASSCALKEWISYI